MSIKGTIPNVPFFANCLLSAPIHGPPSMRRESKGGSDLGKRIEVLTSKSNHG